MKEVKEAIKKIGVGKKGSKALEKEHIQVLKNFFQKEEGVYHPTIGAFWGALWGKEISQEEKELLPFFSSYHVPSFLKPYIEKIKEKKTFSYQEAYTLGKEFLFIPSSSSQDLFFKALFASHLRVRYESTEEYLALLTSLKESTSLPIKRLSKGIFFTEPADGVVRSYLITPLITKHLKEHFSIPITTLSYKENPGPKDGVRLYHLYERNGISSIFDEIFFPDLYHPVFLEWVKIRQAILKRPFFSTLDRILNPYGASYIFYSVAHSPYIRKIADVLKKQNEVQGYIGFRGYEGSLLLSCNHPTSFLIGYKKKDTYKEEEIEVFPPKEAKDFRIEEATSEKNQEILFSPSKEWKIRIKYTQETFRKIFQILQEKVQGNI